MESTVDVYKVRILGNCFNVRDVRPSLKPRGGRNLKEVEEDLRDSISVSKASKPISFCGRLVCLGVDEIQNVRFWFDKLAYSKNHLSCYLRKHWSSSITLCLISIFRSTRGRGPDKDLPNLYWDPRCTISLTET